MSENCPICESAPVARCACEWRESRCAQGHYWYYWRGERVAGRVNHLGATACGSHVMRVKVGPSEYKERVE